MANEIVKTVAKKANISEPIAQIAVDTVLNMVKSKLPASVAGILDTFTGGSGSAKSTSKSTKNDNPLGDLGNIAGTIGGLLGGKKK